MLASERASFSMVFVKIGLVPDMGALYTLPRSVGMSLAKELMLTGRRLGAEEAKRLGLVHAIHPVDDLGLAARRFAARFVHAPREAVALTKRAVNSAFESSFEASLSTEAQAQSVASAAGYFQDAVSGFLRGEALGFDWDRLCKEA
ncbi:Enoyl-CoA hydratase (fragment) [Cupriavidus taiwanensis]|uniref:enoyl-CoA hydratase/isomerase family protein n=1 Tax=Cupriavidus taiwanensis TaxID=164546 RepID=UPI000E164360